METKVVQKRENEPAPRDPFALLRRAMSEWFDEGRESGLGGFSPRVDLKENGKEIVVTAELPGVEEKDVDISLSGDILTIKGEKKHESEDKRDEFYRLERSYGSFRRSFSLPAPVDAEKAQASFTQGVLTVTLPKSTAAAAARKITVNAG